MQTRGRRPVESERLKSMLVRTPLEQPLKWLRQAARIPKRLRHPELREVLLEPARGDRVLATLLNADSNFVDVGAHLGGILSVVVKLAPRGTHIAFEAVPEKAGWLRDKFPEVRVDAIAVSDEPGTARFVLVPGATALSGLHVARDRGTEIEVRCDRLEDLLPGDYHPDVLKIDVIGDELRVLSGAKAVLERARPAILLASGRQKLMDSGSTPEEVFDWLANHGYALYLFRDHLSGGPPLERAAFVAAHDYPYQAFNFVGLPA